LYKRARARAARDLPLPDPPVKHQVLPRGPADLDADPAAGLLGPQHGDQVRDLPGDRLQPRQRGQAA
jgi:hypothetical protein